MTTGRINQVSNARHDLDRASISQPPKGRVSLNDRTVRLDKLPAGMSS